MNTTYHTELLFWTQILSVNMVIKWPNGTKQTIQNPKLDEYDEVTES